MAVEFKTKYNANFMSMLSSMIAAGTPYQATLTFLSEQFEQYNLTDEYKAQLQAQLLSNMTISFTNSAMQTAITVTDKEIMADTQYDNALKQGILLDKQSLKLDADKALVEAQEDAITQQVIDNRKIKVFDTLGETYGTVGAGGLTVSSEMWTTFFALGADLSDFTAPTTTTVTKVV